MALSKLIEVDPEKCNNCHSCIAACPVKISIDGSGDHVSIIDDRCIGCGQCIPACKQGARRIVDDAERFLEDLGRRVPMVAIVAPAAAAVFGEDAPKLVGFLKQLGVAAVFDVAFGAELTVRSYLEYVKKEHPRTVIAQPCPALVNYCQIYRHDLIPFLAPAQSPMAHSAAMIAEYFPQYAGHRIAAISPCAAKKREFDEIGTIHYNVTMLSLKAELERRGKSLRSYEAAPYDGPRPERGVLFSTPGGLLATLSRDAPELVPEVRRIEGPEQVYRYLDELPAMVEEGVAPLLVDCLNCSAGCNGGPGTGNYGEPVDRLEARVEKVKRARVAENRRPLLGNPLKKALKSYWKEGLYDRTYRRLDGAADYRIPNDAELQRLYADMKKYGPEDMLNCSACGYGSCRDMAIAIFNGLNRPENCHRYLKITAEERLREGASRLADRLVAEMQRATELIEELHSGLSRYMEANGQQDLALRESSLKMEELIGRVRSMGSLVEAKRADIDALGSAASQARKDMQGLVEALSAVERSTADIAGIAGIINGVAASTNLLAMNAAIEAAHAGSYGRGFAVVAGEIRNLAETSGANSSKITKNLKTVVDQITTSLDLARRTGEVMGTMVEDVETATASFSEIGKAHEGMAAETHSITEAMAVLDRTAEELRSSCGAIMTELDSVDGLVASMNAAASDAVRGEI